mgnify:CR=1 FL=1
MYNVNSTGNNMEFYFENKVYWDVLFRMCKKFLVLHHHVLQVKHQVAFSLRPPKCLNVKHFNSVIILPKRTILPKTFIFFCSDFHIKQKINHHLCACVCARMFLFLWLISINENIWILFRNINALRSTFVWRLRRQNIIFEI